MSPKEFEKTSPGKLDNISGRASAYVPDPLQLIDQLVAFPVINIPTAQQRLEMTYKGAQKAIEKLEKMGFISETTGQKRNRIYLAKPITDLLVTDDVADFISS